ncbi:hypothetical protein JTB14_024228 [Gonioctena quinquepunctata]|nr:hypothetical protein JTB14_024228 [Gonioctena quinquepunctata]
MSFWRAAQRLADTFWARIFTNPHQKHKWFQDNGEKGIQVGDVVIMVDPDGPRNLWQKAVVINIRPAKDGKTRIVDVRNFNHTVYRRNISKLIVLDVKKKFPNSQVNY